MDDKDGRRPRVPAGTFGDSSPPSSSEPENGETGGADRKRFTSTLTGKGAFGDAETPSVARLLPQRTGNTLVGHPTTAPPVPTGPLLAPPKWRGAKPYLEGEEPQPRVSSIPTPPPSPMPAKPAGVAIGVMRSKVTTKLGHPVAQPELAPQQPQQPPAIDDTIQRMLETQASVPMQVDESAEGDSIPEIPFDQLPIEQLEDSLPRVPKGALAAVRAAEVQAPATKTASEGPGPTVAAAASAPMPASKKPAAASAAARAAESEFAPGLGFASSVAPAEVVRRPRREDSPAMGLLAVAVFAVLFVGGWFVTRGGYAPHRPAMTVTAPAPAAAPAAPAATAPNAPSDLAPAPAAALPTAQPLAAQPPAAPEQAPKATAAEPAESVARRAPSRERSTSKPSAEPPAPAAAPVDDEDNAQPAAAAEQNVLTVKPSLDPANLPDIPGREEVIAALEPLRPAISECSRGTHGVAQLDITVSNSGAVSHAVVGGDFAGTAEGSCIARAARNAQFSPFKKPRFRVIYPFSL